MARVKAAENQPIHTDSRTLVAMAPARAAPPVLATVFSDRMAAMGRSTWDRRRRNSAPAGWPARSRVSMWPGGTE